MKNFLNKHWAVIIWILTVALDEKYGLAEAIFSKAWQISLFQILGSLLLAYKWSPVSNKLNIVASEGAVRPRKPR
jgi:hypothetical protein